MVCTRTFGKKMKKTQQTSRQGETAECSEIKLGPIIANRLRAPGLWSGRYSGDHLEKTRKVGVGWCDGQIGLNYRIVALAGVGIFPVLGTKFRDKGGDGIIGGLPVLVFTQRV